MLTSIIILTYNNLDYTKACIDSIREFTQKGSYEIIVVDNKSTDGTTDWLKEQQDLTCIFNDFNAGFSRGCNQGIDIAKGDTIILLNNDTLVTVNWLKNISTALYSSEEVGAVGTVTNSCSNFQTVPCNYSNIGELFLFSKAFNISDPLKWEERYRLIMFCMAIKRSTIEKVGRLEEIFHPGNFEDDDYSLRIRLAGMKLLLLKDTFIHHFGSQSFNKEGALKSHSILNANQNKFIWKWSLDTLDDVKNLDKIKNITPKSIKDLPLVSVLIPAYNEPTFLKEAVISVLNQSYPNIEIVIVDDSTNNSVFNMINNEFIQNSKIKYYKNKENIGQAASTEILLSLAKGEYINLLMHDDLFEPEKIDRMMSYFLLDKKNSIVFVSSNRYMLKDDKKEPFMLATTKNGNDHAVTLTLKTIITQYLENNLNFVGEPTTVLFKKQALKTKIGEFLGRENICNVDSATWLSLLLHNENSKGIFLMESLSSFRVHDDQKQKNPKIAIGGYVDLYNTIQQVKSLGIDFDYKKACSLFISDLLVKYFLDNFGFDISNGTLNEDIGGIEYQKDLIEAYKQVKMEFQN